MLDVASVRKNWASRGFTCAQWTDPKDQVWENYVHNVDELLMVVQGRLCLEMQGQKHAALPGVEFLIPAHSLHSVRNLFDGTSHWLYGYKTLPCPNQ